MVEGYSGWCFTDHACHCEVLEGHLADSRSRFCLSLDGLDGVDSVGGWLGVDGSTASCIGASLLLSAVSATNPGPNYDLL